MKLFRAISRADEYMTVERANVIPSSPLRACRGVLQTFPRLDRELLSGQGCLILLGQALAS